MSVTFLIVIVVVLLALLIGTLPGNY